MMGTLTGLPTQVERKEGMTSSHHGPYAQGYTRATMESTEGRYTTQHLTARADDSHAAPCFVSEELLISENSTRILAQVRFLAYHRIKPHAPPLVRTPVNSFEFHSCERTPQVAYLTLSLGR